MNEGIRFKDEPTTDSTFETEAFGMDRGRENLESRSFIPVEKSHLARDFDQELSEFTLRRELVGIGMAADSDVRVGATARWAEKEKGGWEERESESSNEPLICGKERRERGKRRVLTPLDPADEVRNRSIAWPDRISIDKKK